MPSFQRVEIMGHLGRDPESRVTSSGAHVTHFSVAVTERWRDKQTTELREKTEWFQVVAWRKPWLNEKLSKGSLVMVTGKLSTREYTPSESTEKRRVVELVADLVLPIKGGSHAEEYTADDGGARESEVAF